ncbi:alpha-tectorin-like [Pempheris klunzingeri]|uniref:alpha-tectorin-like n=1 Tax=Pempheris klunzingeri TaxID=3127111 RepID=UPI00397FEEBF
MLRPLLFLSALIGLAGAWQTLDNNTVVNISSCPITYYGQKYEQLYEFNVLFNGEEVQTFNLTMTVKSIDISGCRHSGVMYLPGTVINGTDKCSFMVCSETAVLTVTGCGPLEHCRDNGMCSFDSTCTVTGPSVIDMSNRVSSVQDRCAYSLMSISSVPGFHLLANFQERRRKDVSFLDSVILRLDGPGVHIHLEQGGRVRLDNTELTLNSSAQLVHGVELSKDQTGVTAKVSLSNYTTSVFFDGYTAQIHLERPAGTYLHGLCNNSELLSEATASDYSASGCEMVYNDTADASINCNMMTERCDLLMEAPFAACHNYTDPEPYVTACSSTLCSYPAVDGLYCHFLEAYARACSQYSNDTLEGWRTNGCPTSQAFCQDRICSAHEFCGQTAEGDKGCFCRAIFASSYREGGALGDPTICGPDSASLTLVGCLLEEKGINYSSLHLNDQTCRGQVDELTHMVTFSYDGSRPCGAVVTANDRKLIYKNSITVHNSSSNVITRQDQFSIDFSCVYMQPDMKVMAFRIGDGSVIQHITSEAWNYNLTMKAYTDSGRTQAVELSTEVHLNQKIWVELETEGLDSGLVAVVTDSCWATNQASPSGSPRYDLIANGCANSADQTVNVVGNGMGTSNYFSFNMFQFSGSSGDVFMHCKLNLCVKQNNNCAPTCGAGLRRRRSARSRYVDEATAFITMAWTR